MRFFDWTENQRTCDQTITQGIPSQYMFKLNNICLHFFAYMQILLWIRFPNDWVIWLFLSASYVNIHVYHLIQARSCVIQYISRISCF